jgi:predicted TIM-barrel fold metal-dependent hydrolase
MRRDDQALSSLPIGAIDVHAHFGTEWRVPMMSADAAIVARRARRAGVDITLVSALAALRPGRAAAIEGNREAVAACRRHRGLRMWAVLNPKHRASFRQVAELLRLDICVGIKAHPYEHRWHFADRGPAVLQFAQDCGGAVVLTHTGSRESHPADIAAVAECFPDVPVILAHLGNAENMYRLDLQTRAIASARRARLYVDTSSYRSILSGLIEQAVRAVPRDRILFGSDSPLYSVHAQRGRIEGAAIPVAYRRRILRDNALRLFGERLGV